MKRLRSYLHVCCVYRVIDVKHAAQVPAKRQESWIKAGVGVKD
jgi:hypothetical protein